MKKEGVLVLFVLFLSINLACASVVVHNYSIDNYYVSGEDFSGLVNITITNENLDYNFTSNLGNSISLRDLLEENGALESSDCFPLDCENGYNGINGASSKTIVLNNNGKYVGFVLNGAGVSLSSIGFNIESDFQKSFITPLKIKFFDSSLWEFSDFSDEYGADNYGCYDPVSSGRYYSPLIDSRYCNKISVLKTGSLQAGALVSGSGASNIRMVLYDGEEALDICTFNPANQNSCNLSIGDGTVFEGNYYLCAETTVSGNTGYNISYKSGSCGWVQQISNEMQVPSNFTRAYGLFIKTAKYSEAEAISDDLDFEQYLSDANEYLDKYEGNCSQGCVLPIYLSGINQNLVFSDIAVSYFNSNGPVISNSVYDLEVIPAKVSYSGLLDLVLPSVNASGSISKFMLYFNGNKILEKNMSILHGAEIKGINPRNPPAGVLVNFIANVEYTSPITSYRWDFGNSTVKYTNTNSVSYRYDSFGMHDITLEVISNGINISRTFSVIVGSSKPFVNLTFDAKKGFLDKTISEVNSFPAWYQKVLKESADIDTYSGELDRLKRAKDNAVDEDDFLEVLIELSDLIFPYSVYIGENSESPLLVSVDDINPSVVAEYAGGDYSGADGDLYKDAISSWEGENIDARIQNKKINLADEKGNIDEILNVYSINVKNNAEEDAYFVINQPKSELVFKDSVGASSAEGSTVVEVEAGSEMTFEFYSASPAEFFVSPKLSLLELAVSIDTTCNFNFRCEKDLGESSSTCRSDCKPIGWTIFWIFILLVGALIAYTFLQIWYKARYETYLFKDRRLLFNILNFVSNARARGMSEKDIISALEKNKWDKERIMYAMKKSRGERTGMYELVPIEKMLAFMRDRGARKNIATGSMQQNLGNINKSKTQGINRW